MKHTPMFIRGLRLPTTALLISLAVSATGTVLNIDAHSNTWKAINSDIYGVNIANWCADYYLRLCQPMLTNARVSVVRYGATNIERYNWRNNRMYNVISLTNQYVPMSWESFIEWCRDMNAKPFLQVSVFGHVASDETNLTYNHEQTLQEVTDWVSAAGTNVSIWGVGNEPFIAWKLVDYKGQRNGDSEGYAYNDGAHGDQIYLEDLAPEAYFPRWIDVAAAIRKTNATARILGPTPANWYLYWGTDYSPFCPATRATPGAFTNDPGWFIMSSGVNQFDGRVFPGRAGSPDVIGYEKNELTGHINDKRNMAALVKSATEYAATHGGTQVMSYLDFHRYMNCDQDAVAVQEVRDLWDPDYQSWDKETGAGGTKTEILNRFQEIIDHFNPNICMSLSEYDYFYWQGHPAEPQISALGEIDYLGTFASHGVQLACNWYVGEPDQSGGGYHHAADSAKQAMFNEKGEPNPKYWALKMMSLNFRDIAVNAGSTDNDAFSVYAGLNRTATQLMVVAHYKGHYYPWNDEHNSGGFIEGQADSNATMVVSNFNITGVKCVQRFGRYDPGIVAMEPGGVQLSGNSFSYEFEPLSVYLFTFYGYADPPAEETPSTHLHVSPGRIDFGEYESGISIAETEDEHTGEITVTTNYSYQIKVTNSRNTGTVWSASESCSWLSLTGATAGTARVTDRIFLTVDRSGLAVGTYSTQVAVVTSEGTVYVPVTMEVIPGEDEGEVRISDFDTGSLAHTWGYQEPYAVGFYDGHGQPPDRNYPFIYMLSMDFNEKSQFGGLASLRVDYDRSNGDTSDGRLYMAFGTYGHTSGTNTAPTTMWIPVGADPSNYLFKFDIKTKTDGAGYTRTEFDVIITDTNGSKGKPNVGIATFKDSMSIEDGFWQTITIPLSTNFFDWRYPGGQNGSTVVLDFSAIKQLEFCPWVGHEDKKGTLWIDNIRIETVDSEGNRYPVAVVEQSQRLIGTNATIQLSATNSYDPDGSIVAYEWSPAAGLSATNTANPTFFPPGPGTYTIELTVTDNQGLKSRNPAQVVINCQPTLYPDSIRFYRDAALTDEITGTASNCIDLYLKLTCFAGGSPESADFTLARVSTSDAYGSDDHNNTAPIDAVLEETDIDSKIFTGRIKLAACSDSDKAEIGVTEGCSITVSNNGYFVSKTIGKQSYGLLTPVDHIEDGVYAFNAFDGIWCSYDDGPNGNSSVVSIATSDIGATSNSTQCMRGEATLHLVAATNSDQLFAGIATKLTPYSNDVPQAVSDLSSTTGIKGLSFWLRGNGTKVSVVLKSFAITNYDDYLYTIDHTPSNGWRKYNLLFTDFAQEGWGNEAVERDTALRLVNAIQFKFASKLDGEHNVVYADDVALFGGDKHYLPHVVYQKQNKISMEGFDGGLMTNGSFGGPGAPGWTLSGNAANEDWGNWRLVMENWTGTNYGTAYQTIGVSTNKAYQFAVNAWMNTGYNGNAYIELAWYDAATNHLGTDSKNITADLTADSKTFTLTWRWAPDNARYVQARLRSAGATVPPYADNAVQFDNAEFSEYGFVADDQWISGWIGGESIGYSTNCVEGQKAMLISSTNRGWLAGMFVAPYGTGQTRTNFDLFSGFALKARRPPAFTNSGTAAARIRIAVATNEDPVARTRWLTVGASEWEDYLLFPKARFLTSDSVDNNDPAQWVVWTNTWRDIRRIIIEYGPSHESNAPYSTLIDDFRPYSDEYVADDIIDPPITNSEASTNVIQVFSDVGIPAACSYQVWSNGTFQWNPDYTGGDAPEGTRCCRLDGEQYDSWGIGYTQSAFRAASTNISGMAWNLDVDGDYAYVAVADQGLKVFNIADPIHPVEVSSLALAYARDVVVSDHYAYVASNPFRVVNVSDPANPVVVGSVSVGSAFSVEVAGHYAYVVRRDTQGSLVIVDVSDPSNPTVTGTARIASLDCHVRISNNYAFVALQDTGFHVIDIGTPSNPLVLTTNAFSTPMGLDLARGYAYVGCYGSLKVVDITTPSAPRVAASINLNGQIRDIRVSGNYAYVAGDTRLKIFDIGNPTNPVFAGYGPEVGALTYGVEQAGDYAFVAAYTSGFQVVDISHTGGMTNLGDYAEGCLKFQVKTPVDLTVGIEAGGLTSKLALSLYNWCGSNTWQDIVIPIRDFGFSSNQLTTATTLFTCSPSGAAVATCLVDQIRLSNQF